MSDRLVIASNEPANPVSMARVDWYTLLAHESGLPEAWRWFELRCVNGLGGNRCIAVRGAVIDTIFSRGKRAGEWNWAKRDKRTEREFIVPVSDIDARQPKWERDTGMCHACFGCRYQLASASTASTTYRSCGRCKGTGRAP